MGNEGPPLAAPDAGDLVGRVLRRAAVAGRHRGDVDVPAALLFEPDERAGAEELGVVGVGEDRDGGAVHVGPGVGCGSVPVCCIKRRGLEEQGRTGEGVKA